MKVLFINTVYQRGSTGRIVADLGQMLEKNGHEFKVAYGRGDHREDSHCYRIGSDVDLYIHAGLSRMTDRAGFYSKKVTEKLIEYIREYCPDIIHLHNLHGYYVNIEVLFDYLAKEFGGRVIWTLHDCWAFTGHCVHFTYAECNKWKTGCNNCPQKHEYPKSRWIDRSENNYTDKKRIFNSVSNMEIITVSNWLKSVVEESYLRNHKVKCIYNGIDTERFRFTPNSVKKELQIEGKKMILLVSDGWIEQKGFSTVLKVAQDAPNNWCFVIIGLDREQINSLPGNIIGFEHIWNQEKLIEFYSAADVFFNPSIEETFGLVTAEAMACGTPVVVMDSTACPELIVEDRLGVVMKKESSTNAFVQGISKLLTRGRNCCIPEQFTMPAFLSSYGKLYDRR